MSVKTIMAKALAPVAEKSAQKTTEFACMVIFNQPKLPKKLMKTVK